MNKLVIGVGGSGTHSILGYIHLCRLLNEPILKPLKPEKEGETPGDLVIFDADKHTNDPDSLYQKFINTYIPDKKEKVKEQLYWINPNPKEVKEGTIFWQLFNNEGFLRYIFEPNQLATPIQHGYIGRPPVGATVAYKKIKDEIEMEKAKPNSLELVFNQKIKNNLERAIFVGSITGGTGAGAVPALARYIKNISNQTEILYLFHGHWFIIDKKGTNITDEDLKRNAVGGMSFLLKEKELFKTRVLLDYSNADMVGRENDDFRAQREKKDFMYLLAGFLIRGYLKTDDWLDGFFGICLKGLRKDESIYQRLIIKNEYKTQDDLIMLNFQTDPDCLFNYIKRAYKVFFYIGYLLRWLDTRHFRTRENPLPQNTEQKILEKFTDVKNRLEKEYSTLKESLEWLEGLSYPKGLQPHAVLPYKLENFLALDTLERMYQYFKKYKVLDPVQAARKFILKQTEQDIPEACVTRIWKIMT